MADETTDVGTPDKPVDKDASRRATESAAALAWLDLHWKDGRVCPICGNRSWTVGNMFELREFRGGDLMVGNSQVMPVFSATCTTCGHAYFFNAIVAGLFTVGGAEKP